MFAELFSDKTIKAKEKTEALSAWLIKHPKKINELIAFAEKSKDPVLASCIEAMEFATKNDPAHGTSQCFDFAVKHLDHKAPRVKWESAKVIGNIAHHYPTKLDKAIVRLLTNSEHTGTVVRWSAAYALSQIVLAKTRHNKELIPALQAICAREEKTSIKKIYQATFKKAGITNV